MKESLLYEKNEDCSVVCSMCSRVCNIKSGKMGVCLTNFNQNGILYSMSWGKVLGTAIDPIEKKPFYNFKPGTRCLSFGTPGCNFFCKNCQNYSLSQGLKDNLISFENISTVIPTDIIRQAVKNHADGIAYTYSEPTIFFEFVRDCILESRSHSESENLYHVLVSNGYMSPELIKIIDQENLIDAINIDLKFMNNKKYKYISKARLEPVLNTIQAFWELRSKVHLEITNLIITGENDSEEDFIQLINFIKSTSKSIPIHFSRFHPCYLMNNIPVTSEDTLKKARIMALEAGLEYVYIGNAEIDGAEDTNCPICREVLIRRNRMRITKNVFSNRIFSNRINSESALCPKCNSEINIIL